MRSQRWIVIFFSGFFALYVVVGLLDQFKNLDDIYPFSDWYLFSYVSRYGEGFDLKLTTAEGDEVLLSEQLEMQERRDLAEDLSRAVRFGRRGEEAKMVELVREVALAHDLKGKVVLIGREYERLEYYKNSQWIKENEITTFEFQ